jgi:hypothetical protein
MKRKNKKTDNPPTDYTLQELLTMVDLKKQDTFRRWFITPQKVQLHLYPDVDYQPGGISTMVVINPDGTWEYA